VVRSAVAPGRARPAPRPAAPPFTVDFGPSARTRLLASAVGQAAAIPANLLSSFLQDHIRDSLRHTPHAPLPTQSGHTFFESIRSGSALRPIDLVRTTIAGYADNLSQNRGSMTMGITLRSIAINAIADAGQRRLAIRDLQGDLTDDLEHLSTVSTNVTRALAQRPELESRAQAAESLAVLLESGPAVAWLLNNGMDPDELSNIISSVRAFAAAHRQTLEALERLRAVVSRAEESDRRSLELLDAAIVRGQI
jgi:hypothetical protein